MATESSQVEDKKAQTEDDPDAIRAEIRATRDEMTETMSAIQERLNPEHLRDRALGSVRRATIGRVEDAADDAKWKVKGAGNDVFETIKSNPAPAVLAAVGLGWLFMESRNRAGERALVRRGRAGDRYYLDQERYGGGGYRYDEYGRRSVRYGEPPIAEYQGQDIRERAGQAVGHAAEKVQDAAQQAGSKVQDVAGQAADAVQDVAYSAKDTAGQVADTAQHVAHQAQYQAQRVGSRFGDMMQENPLVIGAAALALGAIVGFAFPSTEKENEIMGRARDRVVDRAQDAAEDTAQKVQHVAREAATAAKEAAKDEAQKQNLTTASN